MDRRLGRAVLVSIGLHAVLILAGEYRLSYDAYIHMFFGDHYRRSWWSLWEPRWYAGFSVASYPPLVHQLIGLLAHLTGIEWAWRIVLLGVLAGLPAGVYGFARLFTGRTAAGYAALTAAVLPAVYLAAHTFGQLPTLAGLLAALAAAAALGRFLRQGGPLSFAQAVAWTAVMAAAHHGTLLFLPWVVLALAGHLALGGRVRAGPLLARLGLYGAAAVTAVLTVIWPFWLWGVSERIQAPIDHLSRHNYFTDPRAFTFFTWPMFGPLLLFVPWAAWLGLKQRRKALAPGVLFAWLFLLGLGGTTSLPRALFGPGWAWLTYDRFALWSAVALLPFVGWAAVVARRVLRRARLRRARSGLLGRLAGPLALVVLGIFATAAGLQARLLPTQPPSLDLQPIVDFLGAGKRSSWRYVTFGFGDQLARLSLLTEATTIDGSYHTGRGLAELRASGLGQIDTALWSPLGLKALDPILDRAGERGVRWAFVSRPEYGPVLRRHGWRPFDRLPDGVWVWKNPGAVRPAAGQAPPTPQDPFEAVSWGVLPLACLAVALGLTRLRRRCGPGTASEAACLRRGLLAIQRFSVGLLPVALTFWYFYLPSTVQHARVYFTYDNPVFYLSDGLVVVAVAAWLAAWLLAPRPLFERGTGRLAWALLALVLLGSASALWSLYPQISGYAALHLWLMFGLYLSLRSQPESWRALAIGSCFAILIQAVLGITGFISQSTAFLAPLHLNWPGAITAATLHASVVELVDGTFWLRAYGSLPHPNLLAGCLVIFSAGPLGLFLRAGRRHGWAAAVWGLALAVLILTFSRAAWAGCTAGVAVMAGLRYRQHRPLPWRRLAGLGAAGLCGLGLAAVPAWRLVSARIAGAPTQTEAYSTVGRAWMMTEAVKVIGDHPLGGVGLGAYVLHLSTRLPGDFKVEPVHNVLLLAASELGLPGAALALWIAALILTSLRRARSPEALALSVVLVALLVISLLDHYLWTLPVGRTLGWLTLGAWEARLAAGG